MSTLSYMLFSKQFLEQFLIFLWTVSGSYCVPDLISASCAFFYKWVVTVIDPFKGVSFCFSGSSTANWTFFSFTCKHFSYCEPFVIMFFYFSALCSTGGTFLDSAYIFRAFCMPLICMVLFLSFCKSFSKLFPALWTNVLIFRFWFTSCRMDLFFYFCSIMLWRCAFFFVPPSLA